jgi:hypothetical protein
MANVFVRRNASDARARLERLTENSRRGYPHRTPEQHDAAAWLGLSWSDRNEIIESEGIGNTMKNVDVHALAMTALECAAVAIRKNDPGLSAERAFVKAMERHAEVAKIEREEARKRLFEGGAPVALTPRREMDPDDSVAKRDDALALLKVKAEELRRTNPTLTAEGAFVKAMRLNPELAARERSAARAALYAV